MDWGRLLGAVLQGAAAPPRRAAPRRRATASPLGLTQAETRQIGRVVGALAGIAADALAQRQPPRAPEPPPPAPRPAPRPVAVAGAPPPPPPPRRVPRTAAPANPAPPPPEAEEHREAKLLLRAMVAAAKADGALDAAERKAIAAQLDAAGLDAAERAAILAEFDNPAAPETLAKEARDPMLAAQLYAAAFAAAGEVSAAERAWLDRLAKALRLDAAAKGAIEARLGG